MISYKVLFIVIFFPYLIIINGCNPVYEDISVPSWNSLHSSKPFQSDFFHGADYRFPDKACSESQCHGASLTGGNSGAPSCFSCHNNQWSIFGTTHTMKINGFYHNNLVDSYSSERTTNAGWFNSCKNPVCHGAVLDGFQGVPAPDLAYRYSCKVCHSGFSKPVPPPGHRVFKSEDGKSGWHHFNYGNSDPEGSNSACSGAACHGNGSSSGSAADGSGGTVAAYGPSCSTCH